MSATAGLDVTTSQGQMHKSWKYFLLVWLVLGLLFSVLHLRAIGLRDTPEQAPISALQGIVAATSNFLGPWAGHLVRVVDFPNAGLRNFRWSLAALMTLAAFTLVAVGTQTAHRGMRVAAMFLFTTLMVFWYAYGFFLIAAGLL